MSSVQLKGCKMFLMDIPIKPFPLPRVQKKGGAVHLSSASELNSKSLRNSSNFYT